MKKLSLKKIAIKSLLVTSMIMILNSCGKKTEEFSLEELKRSLISNTYYVTSEKSDEYGDVIKCNKKLTNGSSNIDIIEFNNESDARAYYKEHLDHMQDYYKLGVDVVARPDNEVVEADDPDRNKLKVVPRDGYEMTELKFDNSVGVVVKTPSISYYVYRDGCDIVYAEYSTADSEIVESDLTDAGVYMITEDKEEKEKESKG